ncbi:hypothetical protein N7528_007156 [Penicillium herquei]|nr:hypothetical protein N7528_007156 [Penicillium herquei]
MPARDALKALGQKITLAEAQPAEEQHCTSTLLVCGVTKPRDGWIFTDFFGVSQAFEPYGGSCELLACYDLGKHFEWLVKDQKVNVKDIKFGKYGPNQVHLYTYEKSQYEQCPLWWTSTSPERLLHEVEFWLGKASKKHKADDKVNVFLFCHGSEDGEFSFGSKILSAAEIVRKMGNFKAGVHVTLFSNACFSGIFCEEMERSGQANRYVAVASHPKEKSYSTTRSISGRNRSGRFVNAVVESMLKPISDPDNYSSWTVQDHEDHIQLRCRNITPRQIVSLPQFFHAGFNPTTMRLKDLFLRDDQKVHTPPSFLPSLPPFPPLSPSSSASHTDWNNAMSILRDAFTRTLANNSLDNDVPPSAQEVAKQEGDLCWLDSGDPTDMGIFSELWCPQPNWRVVLTNIYWRSFRQTAIWQVYLRLLEKGIVNTESLISPIDLVKPTSNSHCISRLLGCFDFLATQSHDALLDRIPGQSCPWTADTSWIATIIVRSGADIDSVVAEIKASKILGELRYDRIGHWRQAYPEVNVLHDPQDGEGTLKEDGLPEPEHNTFAFWLPHGLTNDPQIQDERLLRCSNRAKAIQMAFAQVETLPISILILDWQVFRFGSESRRPPTPGDEGDENHDKTTVEFRSVEGHNHERDKPSESDDSAIDLRPDKDKSDHDKSSYENELFGKGENFDELWWLFSDC